MTGIYKIAKFSYFIFFLLKLCFLPKKSLREKDPFGIRFPWEKHRDFPKFSNIRKNPFLFNFYGVKMVKK